MRILILKPSSLGDVIQALPLLRLLKLHDPASEIHWWLAADLVPLLAGDPDLKSIIPFDRRFYRSLRSLGQTLAEIRRMRQFRFDWVIDLQGLARSGAFAWLANGGFMVGLDTHREGARGFYDLVVPRPAPTAHAVDWYLNVLSALSVPIHWNFTWLPARPVTAAEVRRQWKIDAHRWVLLSPGARWANKRWPVEHFSELVTRLSTERPDLRFAVLGSRADRSLGAAIRGANADVCLDLTGKTSLPELIEWIRLSELVVTNDTGPMHVAAALGKPVVALFGPTDPRHTGPYRQPNSVLKHSALPCLPCMKSTCAFDRPKECLTGLETTRVYAEVMARLAVGTGSQVPVSPGTGSARDR